jgi:MFS transporter, SHS family, lactate transporter
VGAAIFGYWADKVGRRTPLLVCVLFYSTVGFLTAFSPSLTVLLILRCLYGIGMGGEWGLGASLAMEKIPAEKRGFFSGVLQQGYPVGYLFAAIAFFLVEPTFGWRGLFVVAAVPALLALFLRMRVSEPEAWEETKARERQTRVGFREVLLQPRILRRFVYLVALMTPFNFLSHGTQDFFPTFLEDDHGAATTTVTIIAIIYNIGAILGGRTSARCRSASGAGGRSSSAPSARCRSHRSSPMPRRWRRSPSAHSSCRSSSRARGASSQPT